MDIFLTIPGMIALPFIGFFFLGFVEHSLRTLLEYLEDRSYRRAESERPETTLRKQPLAQSNHRQVNRLTMQDRNTLKLIGKQIAK